MHHQCTQNGRVSLSVIMKTLTLLTKIRRSMPLLLWKQKWRAREGKGRSVPHFERSRLNLVSQTKPESFIFVRLSILVEFSFVVVTTACSKKIGEKKRERGERSEKRARGERTRQRKQRERSKGGRERNKQRKKRRQETQSERREDKQRVQEETGEKQKKTRTRKRNTRLHHRELPAVCRWPEATKTSTYVNLCISANKQNYLVHILRQLMSTISSSGSSISISSAAVVIAEEARRVGP